MVEVLKEALPPGFNAREFIVAHGILGDALRPFNVVPNVMADTALYLEAYKKAFMLVAPVRVKNYLYADQGMFYLSHREKLANFRIRVCFGRFNPELKLFRLFKSAKFQYEVSYDSPQRRWEALNELVAKFSSVYQYLTTRKFSEIKQVRSALIYRGFRRYT